MELADKIAGRARYTADLELPGMCEAALARSPYPHGRILGVDVSEALAVPGVVAAFSGRDLGLRLYGRRVRDIPILAVDEVHFIGEPVAAVVASSREAAEAAAELVRVEYEELPAILDARESKRFHSVTSEGSREAAEAALAESAHRVDATYTTPTVHQGYLEPHACVASWESGSLRLWATNKSPYRLRAQVAECLGLEPSSVVVLPVALGADFGGKGSPMHAPLCAELSRRTGRPVRLVLRHWEELTAANPRHPARIRVRAGCDGEGRLTGLVVETLADGGAYAGYKPREQVDLHGLTEPGLCYRFRAGFAEAAIAFTDTVPRGHMRAPGSCQAEFAFESALDELARAAAIDPFEFRRRNLLRTGEAEWPGETPLEARSEETLRAALEAYRPLPEPPGWRHGRGVAIYSRGTGAGRTSLRLSPTPAGGVRVEVPMPDNGAGQHGSVRNGLAELLGVRPELVEVVQVATDELPQDDGVGGSRVTGGLSHALAEAAAAFRGAGGAETVEVRVDPRDVPSVSSCCVQLAQVAVDPATGQVRVLEVVTAADVASVLNPPGIRHQLEGGAAMGFGFACLEDLGVAEGRVWAANLGELKLPSSRDVPAWRTVLVPGARGIGGLGVKAAGELSNVPTAAAIANAVADACGARVRDLPITAERVRELL